MILAMIAGLFLALCVFAALHDVNRLTIPNWLNVTLAVLFVPAAFVSGVPMEIIGGHLITALCAFLTSALQARGCRKRNDSRPVGSCDMIWPPNTAREALSCRSEATTGWL